MYLSQPFAREDTSHTLMMSSILIFDFLPPNPESGRLIRGALSISPAGQA